jgi:hypothetical protein
MKLYLHANSSVISLNSLNTSIANAMEKSKLGEAGFMHLNNIKFPLFMLKVLMLHLFYLPMLVGSCFNNLFLTKFLFIGSGLDLNVLDICFLTHSYMFNLYIWEHHRNYHAYLNGYKERAFGRQPIIFLLLVYFCFFESWKLLPL